MSPANPSPPQNLVGDALSLLKRCGVDYSGRWLLIDALGQSLHLMAGDTSETLWPVSTAETGLDNRDGSGGTPPGFHRIDRLIGRDVVSGAVFESREPTGRHWDRADPPVEEDLILTRVMTLVGCEEGINQGPGVDSRERYIYIHGTNHEDRIGSPVSHGCVRMTNRDVIDLFGRVEEGDPVVIL